MTLEQTISKALQFPSVLLFLFFSHFLKSKFVGYIVGETFDPAGVSQQDDVGTPFATRVL